jgi:hypothetical protein
LSFNQVFFDGIVSKLFLFVMGLVTFIRIPLLSLFQVNILFPPFVYLKGCYSFQAKSLWGIFGVINLDLWSKEMFYLG